MAKAVERIITSLRRLNPIRSLCVIPAPSPMVGSGNDMESKMTRHEVMGDVVAKVDAIAAMDMCRPDPIYELIAAHRRVVIAYNEASAPDDSPEQEALAAALGDAEKNLLHGPSTVAGWEALILYANRQPSLHGYLEQLASEFASFLKRGTKHQQPKPAGLSLIANWTLQNFPKTDFVATLANNRNNAQGLVALYDSCQAAADAMLLLENQPRAGSVRDFLEDEGCRFKEMAQQIGAVLAAMKEVHENHAEQRAMTLFNCALDMGFELDQATIVLMEATATPRPSL